MAETAAIVKATATATAIDRFAKIIKENSERRVGSPEDILGRIHKLRATVPTLRDEGQVAGYLRSRTRTLFLLLSDYLRARLSSKYPLIDPALWEKRRHVAINAAGRVSLDTTRYPSAMPRSDFYLDIPLFATVKLDEPGGDRTVVLGSKSFTRERGWRSVRKTVTLTATLPPIPDDVMDSGHTALGWCHGLVGEMYRDTDLAVLLRRRPVVPSLSISWIPKPDAIGVKQVEETILMPRPNIDPVMTLDHDKDRYVIALYDIPDEEAYEGLIREYTSGSFDGVASRQKK